jgi:Uncharacterized protein conserved in bacteria (DUF2059)
MHMNTRSLTMTKMLALCLLAAPALSADTTKSREFTSLTRLDEFAAGAYKLSMRQKQAQAGFTDAQLACIEAIPSTKFTEPVATAIAEGLSDAELAVALEFFGSPAGKKLLSVMNANMKGEAPVVVSPAQGARIQKFEATSAGDKLMNKSIFVSADVVSEAAKNLTIEAIAQCPKPAP